MPCESMRQPGQSLSERKEQIRETVSQLDKLIASRRVQVTVGPQGAVAFTGWPQAAKNGVTDACAYRRIMATGSALARAQIAKAEQLAGRAVNRQVVGQGVHSHDGGRTWHGKG